MPIFATFKLLHLDFGHWPICQWPNQCALLHNELLIFLIPLPKAAQIYQNVISRVFFSLPSLPVLFLSRSGWMEKSGSNRAREAALGYRCCMSVSAWSLAQPVNRL